MRRKERAVTSQSVIDDIISSSDVLRLGMCVDQVPYIVPLNFGYDGKCFYVHCASEGKKLDMIKQNPKVCFELDTDHELVTSDQACKFTMHYSSVIGFGRASILENEDEKIKALDSIMSHFTSGHFEYPKPVINRLKVIKIDIDSMTGKHSL